MPSDMMNAIPWSAVITVVLVSLCVVIAVVYGRVLGAFLGAPIRMATTPVDVSALVLLRPDGSAWPLRELRDQVVVLVNTASKCGFTGQYDGLEKLWQTYRDRGLVVIAVPTNDFLRQEPGDNAQIAEFCRINHGVTFPIMAKATVSGQQTDPVYAAIQQSQALGGGIKWNFEKCLIDGHGKVRARIAPRVTPDDPRFIALIESLLAELPKK